MSTSIWKRSRSSVWSYCQRMVTHADRDTYVSYCGGLFANFARHEKQLKLQKIYVVRSHKPDTENMFAHIFIGTIKRDKCPQNAECFIVIEKRIILLAKRNPPTNHKSNGMPAIRVCISFVGYSTDSIQPIGCATMMKRKNSRMHDSMAHLRKSVGTYAKIKRIYKFFGAAVAIWRRWCFYHVTQF